ncbi:MAG: cysteine desulfurase NifS [Oscillospiraceae bacterium]|nr:cysteine desulfurase NifS [Oscillospiraceae bacterium]
MPERFVYADNAATTRVSDRVLEAMLPWLTEGYGNPSSIYALGRRSKVAIEAAREKVAKAIGAEPSEIYFTGCGSEADNWAIKGALSRLSKKGKNHFITSAIEHHAVLHTANALKKSGVETTLIGVDADGRVSPEEIAAAIRPETALVSIMYANNEIGTIQPIAEIAKICKEKKVLFHTDAVQAVGTVPINVKELGVDMLSLSGHKLHAPKGIGALYIRKGVFIDIFMDGGGQERSKRAGTENVAGIVGLGEAMEYAAATAEERIAKVTAMRDRLIDGIIGIKRCRLNGSREHRLPGNVNISFEGIEGESLLLMLDMSGICASSGSACTSGSLDPSHVLLAIGLPAEIAHGSLRLSLNDYNTDEDVDYILEKLPPIIERLRMMSPLWEKIVKEENQ